MTKSKYPKVLRVSLDIYDRKVEDPVKFLVVASISNPDVVARKQNSPQIQNRPSDYFFSSRENRVRKEGNLRKLKSLDLRKALLS